MTLISADDKEPLTDRQRQVLDFISRSIERRGYPPTLREIGEQMGIQSTNGVNDHLKALEKKGYLEREDLKSRALRPIRSTAMGPHATTSSTCRCSGKVAAGQPILAVEQAEDTVRSIASSSAPATRRCSRCGQGRLDDRGRHLRRRFHLRAQAARPRTAATSWWR